MPKRSLIPGILAAILVGCARTPYAAAPTPIFVTATLAAASAATQTPLPAAAIATATPMPVVGTTTTQVNVRQEPLSSGRVLGTLGASANVQIYLRDPAGNWYQIAYDAGDGGRGWVAAQYISVADASAVPSVSSGGERMASVRERVNVRSGPGIQFDGVGLLSPRDVVSLTGMDRSGAWVQINFPGAPEGRGWVAASFLDAAQTDGLPIVTEAGEVLGTSTPATKDSVATTAPAIAFSDGDTAAAPAVDARFSPAGLGAVLYSSDLSAPTGDDADWIQFSAYNDSMRVRLDCEGNGRITTEIIQEGGVVNGPPAVECGSNQVLALKAGDTYTLHLSMGSGASEEAYVSYTLGIFAVPAS